MLNGIHASPAQRDMRLRDLLARGRHEGCGGRAAKAELLAGVDGVSSRPCGTCVDGRRVSPGRSGASRRGAAVVGRAFRSRTRRRSLIVIPCRRKPIGIRRSTVRAQDRR
jgi:hypothetical protein